jgi:hypothetical protein
MGIKTFSCAVMVFSALMGLVCVYNLNNYGARETAAAMPIVFSGGLIAFAIAGLKK